MNSAVKKYLQHVALWIVCYKQYIQTVYFPNEFVSVLQDADYLNHNIYNIYCLFFIR